MLLSLSRSAAPYVATTLLLLAGACASGSDTDDRSSSDDTDASRPDPAELDTNGDGSVDILIIGTTLSIDGVEPGFAPDPVALQLQALLEGDPDIGETVRVDALDLHRTATVDTGYGGAGETYSWVYSAHSLAQFLYWPEGRDARWAELGGEDTPWDHVVLAADPRIVSETPGFFAVGVDRVAARVADGGARPLLLMGWPAGAGASEISGIAASTQRVRDLGRVDMAVAPAALAWSAVGEEEERGDSHPGDRGAFVSAATLYGQLTGREAGASAHTTDAEVGLADAAWDAVEAEWARAPITGPREASDPSAAVGISDRVLNYNHTGTSSENGIRGGLSWVLERARVRLVSGGEDPLDFNYGRANTEFEADKRYRVDPARFEVSVGFPMQDHGNNGDLSMRYGLDRRRYPGENGTDLGVARYMIAQGEVPDARALPIRTLYARMHEVMPEQSAYRDSWHMHRDLDKASGAFLYTLLTGHCALDSEPEDPDAWRSWASHRIGYETAWAMTHLSGRAPCFRVLPASADSTWISTEQEATLEVSFAEPPEADVTVTLSVSDASLAEVSPAELVFTPGDHASPRLLTLSGRSAEDASVVLTATTRSADPAFDGLVDRWTYDVVP